MDYLPHLPATARIDEIVREHDTRQKWVNQEKKGFLRYRQPYLELAKHTADFIDCSEDKVRIGDKTEISEETRTHIKEQLKCFMPWRKGPFSVFGIDIDAEWRSERKWQRVVPELPDLAGKVIADIGCNNGYYMFRMAPSSPKFVLGFEPSIQHYYCFKALNAMAGYENLEIDLLGVEHIALFESTFDVIFLMGIIYHRPSPIDTLRDLLTSLKPGGTLILETQAIPGEESYALFPEKTYAKVPGTYFVPTGLCLKNWMEKAGFEEVHLFSSLPMSSNEQRKTEWMQFESYRNFLDPMNSDLTIEGYPAPLRTLIKGTKKTS
jgi:tRNA (mo5U34)-methyltransferase